MTLSLYIARLKCIFRNKESIFWSFLFPIMLATCFFFAFKNVMTYQSFETISVAYATDSADTDEFEIILKEAKFDGKQMFDITYSNELEAKELLDQGKVEAYIVNNNLPELYIKENGLNETVIKSFLDSYLQTSSAVHAILEQNPKALEQGLLEDVMKHQSFVEEKGNEKKADALLIYFYALLAYTCVFAANWGLEEVINIQADQSLKGARINTSPIHKMKLFLINLSASFTAHLGSLALLFFYMYYVIKVDFGDNLLHLFVICILGSMTGLSLGATIGVWVKKKPEVKEAILTFVVLGGGFLSGMMIVDIKYYVARYIPILQYLNPSTLLTDAMYCLYYYDNYDRYYLSAVILCIITLFLSVASYVGIRRKSYASI